MGVQLITSRADLGTPGVVPYLTASSTFALVPNHVDAFKERFAEAAVGQFGSGWAWLIAEGGKLKVIATPDGEDPLPTGAMPLLTLDVWEHSSISTIRTAGKTTSSRSSTTS